MSSGKLATTAAAAAARVDGRDNWATPHLIYDAICVRWDVYPLIDVAASSENSKCSLYFTENDDALAIDWTVQASLCNVAPIFWMNCPYSQPLMTRFIEKAIHEHSKGATTVFLLPAFVDQKWFYQLIKPFEHDFWEGRIKHLPPAGIKASQPRYGSVHGVIR